MLAAVLADPEDDTVRLAYADWLDENGGMEECTRCRDRRVVGWDYVNGIGKPPKEYPCPECTVPGYEPKPDGCRELGEFIRLQCKLARNPQVTETCPHCGSDDGYNHNSGCLYSREYELRTAHPEWSRCKCPACGGYGQVTWAVPEEDGGPVDTQCRTCGGTGDLLRQRQWDAINSVSMPRPVRFRRGFVDEVECRMEEVVTEEVCPRCSGDGRAHGSDRPFEWAPDPEAWKCPECLRKGIDSRRATPTPWARAVVVCLPVTRFRVTDREPHWNGAAYCWYHPDRRHPSNNTPSASVLPPALFDAIEQSGSEVAGRWKGETTAEAANGELALTVARWVRGEVARAR
jgi:uncharacterized protein (TIGR02996 family)